MEHQLINFGSIIGKDILNVSDGSFVGTVQGTIVDAQERNVLGLVLKSKSLLSNKAKSVLPFSQVKSLSGDLVTVNAADEVSLEGRNIIGLSVITADGVFLGKIVDFAFAADGKICEYILKDGVMKGLPNDRGAVSNMDIINIGKDAVIAREGLTEGEFAITDDDIYGDWQKVDEILADISQEDGEEAEKKTDADTTYEEHFDEMTEKIGKVFSDAGQKIKEIDTDQVCSKIRTQAGKLSDSFFSFCADVKHHAKSRKYEKEAAKAQEAQAKKANEPHNVEIDFDDLAKQFNGQVVHGALLDDEGNVLVWSGQEVTADVLRDSERVGKLDELLELIKKKDVAADEIDEADAAAEETEAVLSETEETVSATAEDKAPAETEEEKVEPLNASEASAEQ